MLFANLNVTYYLFHEVNDNKILMGSLDFVGAHICKVPFKHPPQPLRSDTKSYGTIGQLLKFPPDIMK